MATVIGASTPDQPADPADLSFDPREFRRPLEQALSAIGDGADALADLARLMRAVHEDLFLDVTERDATYASNALAAAAGNATRALFDVTRHIGTVQALAWVRDEAQRNAQLDRPSTLGEDDDASEG